MAMGVAPKAVFVRRVLDSIRNKNANATPDQYLKLISQKKE